MWFIWLKYLFLLFYCFVLVFVDDAREDYRLAFRHPVNSAEDAKSELIKLFQECYHKEHGQAGFVPVEPPVVVKYA